MVGWAGVKYTAKHVTNWSMFFSKSMSRSRQFSSSTLYRFSKSFQINHQMFYILSCMGKEVRFDRSRHFSKWRMSTGRVP